MGAIVKLKHARIKATNPQLDYAGGAGIFWLYYLSHEGTDQEILAQIFSKKKHALEKSLCLSICQVSFHVVAHKER